MLLTQLNQPQERISTTPSEMAESCEFPKKGRVCEGTSRLSSCYCIPLDISGGTLDGNHDTKQHPPLHSAH